MVAKRLIILGILAAPWVSLAHSLGHVSISHYTNIQAERDTLVLHYVLDLTESPTFQALQATSIVQEGGHSSLPATFFKV